MIPHLDPFSLRFPSIERALSDPDGLLAAGGDLRSERLLEAYSQGIFPWYSDNQPILWWCPSERAVIFPGEARVNRSFRKFLRQQKIKVSIDQCFEDVIRHCASVPRNEGPGTWINESMIEAYYNLYILGHAHSVEVYQDGSLVGGLYGVSIGGAFCGESMFSLRPNASKCALLYLSQTLEALDFSVIDCQIMNPYLEQMGARSIPRSMFLQILGNAVTKPIKPNWSWPTKPLNFQYD